MGPGHPTGTTHKGHDLESRSAPASARLSAEVRFKVFEQLRNAFVGHGIQAVGKKLATLTNADL
jgi:hypothetical protein